MPLEQFLREHPEIDRKQFIQEHQEIEKGQTSGETQQLIRKKKENAA